GRRDHPAAAARDDLVPVEAEAAADPERPRGTALVRAAERLGRVLDDGQAMALGERDERVEVHRVPEQVDRDDRREPPSRGPVARAVRAALALAFEETADLVDVELPAIGRDVDEDGVGPAVADRVRGGDEGEVGDDDQVVAADSRREERDVQGGRAALHRDGVRGAHRLGERGLESLHERADIRDPVRVDALLQVAPLVPAHDGHAQGDASHRFEYGGQNIQLRSGVRPYAMRSAPATPAIDPAAATATASGGESATIVRTRTNGRTTAAPTSAAAT